VLFQRPFAVARVAPWRHHRVADAGAGERQPDVAVEAVPAYV
jgi:hypothetical protein